MADDTPRRRRGWLWLVAIAAVVVIAYVAGVIPRLRTRQRVRDETHVMATRYVAVVKPQRSAPVQSIVLPGDVQAFTSTPIFARTSGYLKKWYVDIGAPVKRGQILAVIETPEVDQELQQARDVLASAEANLALAEVTAKRYTASWQARSVSQQELDTALSSLQANRAAVAADRADVRRLEALTSFQIVRAPFDGVISARNTDVGDLINAGSTSTPQTELFHIVQPSKLRVYVSVPEAYASSAKPGLHADLVLAATPGKTLSGTIARTASAIDPTTRTLQIEIRLDNADGQLFAGTYAQVTLELPTPGDVFTLPVETLIFRSEGLTVSKVVDGRAVMVKVDPGRDFGDRIEIVRGLSGDEQVIVSPPDSLTAGEAIQIAKPAEKPGVLARPPAAPVRKSRSDGGMGSAR